MLKDVRCGFCKTGEETTGICGSLHTDTLNGKQIAAHHKCMQYSASLVQYKTEGFGGFRIHEVLKELNRGKFLKCELCKTKSDKKIRKAAGVGGATAGCAVEACRKTFHYYCVASHKDTVAKRYKVTQGKKVVICYRVFCSKDHEEYYRTHIGAEDLARQNASSSGSDQDDVDDADQDDEDRDDPSGSDSDTGSLAADSDVSVGKGRKRTVTSDVGGGSGAEMSPQEVVACAKLEYRQLLGNDDTRNGAGSSTDALKVAGLSTDARMVAGPSGNTRAASPAKPMSPVNGKSNVTQTDSDNNMYISPSKKKRQDGGGDGSNSSFRETIAMATDDSGDNLTEDFNTSNSAGYTSDGDLEDTGQDNWVHIIASRLVFGARDMKRVCTQLKIPYENATLWSSTCKPDGFADDHMPFIMWDIANLLLKGDTSGLLRVLFEPSVAQYDWTVRFHSEAGNLEDTRATTFASIHQLLGQLNKKLRHDAGQLLSLAGRAGGGKTHVLAVSLSGSIDRNHMIRDKLQEHVYQWTCDTVVTDSPQTQPDAAAQCKLITDWLVGKVRNNFELERYPMEQTLRSQRVVRHHPSVAGLVSAGLESASQTVLTMASAKILVVDAVDRDVVQYDKYVHKLLSEFVHRNDSFDCFFVFDVDRDDTAFRSLKGIVPAKLSSRMARVYSAYNPQYMPVSCLIVYCPNSPTDSGSQI